MTNNDGEALEEMEKQDIGAITKLEFKTYQKVEVFKGRLKNLGEKIRMHQDEVYQNTWISIVGALGGGGAFILGAPGFGIAGTGIAVLTAILSYVNRKRTDKYKRRFERNKNALDRLEESQVYHSLGSKIYEKE